jgi:predicted metal-binding membrane protein
MAGMDAGPGTDPGSLGFYLSTWVVMMAAMMLPSALPAASQALTEAILFSTGYLLVWGAAGLIAYAALKLGRSLDGSLFAWRDGGRWVATGVLVASASYELTPFKRSWLERCRATNGTDAPTLTAGIRYGTICFACCFGLMAALFALGEMSLVWMVVIAVVIAAQKLLPWPRFTVLVSAALLTVLALGLASAPNHVPGLTVPTGHAMAMHAISMRH